jgi:hypothetical protein
MIIETILPARSRRVPPRAGCHQVEHGNSPRKMINTAQSTVKNRSEKGPLLGSKIMCRWRDMRVGEARKTLLWSAPVTKETRCEAPCGTVSTAVEVERYLLIFLLYIIISSAEPNPSFFS